MSFPTFFPPFATVSIFFDDIVPIFYSVPGSNISPIPYNVAVPISSYGVPGFNIVPSSCLASPVPINTHSPHHKFLTNHHKISSHLLYKLTYPVFHELNLYY